MGGPGTSLADIKRGRLGNMGIVIKTDMRIRCIGADLSLPEFVGLAEKSSVPVPLEDLQSQNGRTRHAGHKGIMKSELIRYQ